MQGGSFHTVHPHHVATLSVVLDVAGFSYSNIFLALPMPFSIYLPVPAERGSESEGIFFKSGNKLESRPCSFCMYIYIHIQLLVIKLSLIGQCLAVVLKTEIHFG